MSDGFEFENGTSLAECHENMYTFSQYALIFYVGTPLASVGEYFSMR